MKCGLFLFFKLIFTNSTEDDTNDMYVTRVSICYNTQKLVVIEYKKCISISINLI